MNLIIPFNKERISTVVRRLARTKFFLKTLK